MHSDIPETLNKTSVETEVEIDVSYKSRKHLFLPLFFKSLLLHQRLREVTINLKRNRKKTMLMEGNHICEIAT